MRMAEVNGRAVAVTLWALRTSSPAASRVRGSWQEGWVPQGALDGVSPAGPLGRPGRVPGQGGGGGRGRAAGLGGGGPHWHPRVEAGGSSAEGPRGRESAPGRREAGAEVTVPAPGRSPGEGCLGLGRWEGESRGPARLPGGGEEAREAGRRRRSPRDPLAQRRPLHSEPRPPPAPQPTWGRNFLRSCAPEESAQPCDDRRRRPEPGAQGPGPPSVSAAGSAPGLPPPAELGGPGRQAGSPPRPGPAGDSRVRGLRDPGPLGEEGRSAGPAEAAPASGGPSRRAGGTPGEERAGPRRQPRAGRRMKSPVRRPERHAR